MKDKKFISPFKCMCVTVGNLPTAYIESMSYYEALTYFMKFLENTIIPALNSNTEAIIELQKAYDVLKEYVDNYFDNLDVQEEINNKLDQMADNGELTDIIAQYLGLAGMLVYNTVADMKTAENLTNGSSCETLGYYSISDGGKAIYKVREVINTDVIDEMELIALHDPSLVAELIYDNELNIECLGAKNDGVYNNITELTKALTISYTKNVKIKLQQGIYAYSGKITVPSNQNGIYLSGANQYKTVIQTLDDDSQIEFSNFLRSKIENIKFVGTGTENVPLIYLNGVSHLSKIQDCIFNTNMGVDINNSAYMYFNNCSFTRYNESDNSVPVNYLLRITSNTNEYLYLNSCQFEGLSSSADCSPVQLLGGHHIYINDCDFCNWFAGVGIKLGGSNSLKNIYISNSTFVRNNKAILLQCDKGISDINLDNNDFILINGNEDYIILNQREAGQTGVTAGIYGHNNINSTYDITNKTMLESNTFIRNGDITFTSTNGTYPEWDYRFPVYFELNKTNQYIYSGTGVDTITKVITEKSPYRSNNIPDVKYFISDGLAPQDITVTNTYKGNLEVTLNYASIGNPYTAVQFRFKN